MSVSFSTAIMKKRPPATHMASEMMREALRRLPPTTVSSLTNGFRVACEENPHAKFATVGIWMDCGSKYEVRGLNLGAAKLLELCGLQATQSKSRSEISKAIDSIGGHLNVQTGVEHSYVYVKCLKEHVPKAVEILADISFQARLADEDIVAAKAQLSDLKRMHEEKIDHVVAENLLVCAYDSTDSGIGNTVLVKDSVASGLDKNILQQFRKTHYTAPRMVLVGVGAVSHSSLEKLAQQHFSSLPTGIKPKIESRYVGGDYRLWNMRSPMAFIHWAVETPGAMSGDNVPLNLVTHMYGGFHRSQHDLTQHSLFRVLKMYSSMDQSGPLMNHFPFQAIETGSATHHVFEDSGLLGMNFVTRHQMIEPGQASESVMQLLQYSMAIWTRHSNRSIADEELEQGKVNYKSQLLFNMDGSTNTAEDIGKQVLHLGRRVPLAEMYDRIDDVTVTNMMEVLQHYYYSRRPVFSFGGNLGALPGYDWMSIFTWKVLSFN